MNELDPARRTMQPPIPTHPPDPAEQGDQDKIVGPEENEQDPRLHSMGLQPGKPIDEVGGPGLGKPPQEGHPAGERDREVTGGQEGGG